ncbi:RtcB family protein [Nitrosococcus oceani]|uniref:RtcB family protein n=1 Tax=Nitrosococcus oceani TaxID=1229 RepID=UPI000183C9D9|nr:RtcB family protein [Nitrosococcus oceani]EDZ67051.1 hypothetical protein NOC27_378 [Nitrosococcus oceani AFC27]GEM20721.1 hypothetical protein NONS58_21410 [Nitrosococcus oceani]
MDHGLGRKEDLEPTEEEGMIAGAYGLGIQDRELGCVLFHSPESQDYFAAMKCALNMSFANRKIILYRVREVFSKVSGQSARDLGMYMIYDVANNTAKLESYQLSGKQRALLVHRKEALAPLVLAGLGSQKATAKWDNPSSAIA